MSHPHDLADPFRNLEILREKVEAFWGQMLSRYPTQFACRAGCSGCCAGERTVSHLELDALQRGLSQLTPEEAAALPQDFDPEGPCPLLVEGRCALYWERPILCRSFGLPSLLEGQRDVCPLNFEEMELSALPPEQLLSVDTLTAILVSVNALYCKETGKDPGERLPVSHLWRR